MKRVIATPFRLLKPQSQLSEQEKQELALYGEVDIPPEEAAEIENERQQEIERRAEYERTLKYRDLRAIEFSEITIGEQLDAILKAFHYLRGNGIELPPETNTLIDKWLNIKAKYPKPENMEPAENENPDSPELR